MEGAIERKRKRERSRRAVKKRRQRWRAEERGICFRCCSRPAGYGHDCRYCSTCGGSSDRVPARRQVHNELPPSRRVADVIVISDSEVVVDAVQAAPHIEHRTAPSTDIDQQLRDIFSFSIHSVPSTRDISSSSQSSTDQSADTGSTCYIQQPRYWRYHSSWMSSVSQSSRRLGDPETGSTPSIEERDQ
eukprot:GILK01005051.1.p1 GENE.GILK01005051.1~~GILK01005051.1.p1  ORF type:complete len:189 (-),score=3.78 GILK01005051.1:293-859(-)